MTSFAIGSLTSTRNKAKTFFYLLCKTQIKIGDNNSYGSNQAKMVNNKSELHQKSVLQIKQDDKFFCRLLSKESSMSNPSFRMALAVPFVWESQPGTPKHTFSEDTLPPLTPPPSYHFNFNAYKKKEKKHSKSKLLLTLLPKLNLKKMILSSSYSSWSSSSSSSKVVPMAKFGKKKLLGYGSSNDNEGSGAGSPSSKLCFTIPRASSS